MAFAFVKLLVVLLVLWGIRGALEPAWQELQAHGRHWRWSWLIFAGAVYLAGLVPAAWLYEQVLRSNGQRPKGWSAWRAFYISELGKYVPGKAMVVVLRTALARGPSVDATAAAIGVFYETFSVMAVGCLIGAISASLWLRERWELLAAIWVLAVGAWVPLYPAVFGWACRWAGRIDRDREQPLSWHVPRRVLAVAWPSLALGWVAWGISLSATLVGLGSSPHEALAALPRTTAAAALGVGIGFFSLIPGGAVVREGVIMQLLRPIVGEGVAMLAPIVLRGVWLLSELAISVILYGGSATRRGPS